MTEVGCPPLPMEEQNGKPPTSSTYAYWYMVIAGYQISSYTYIVITKHNQLSATSKTSQSVLIIHNDCSYTRWLWASLISWGLQFTGKHLWQLFKYYLISVTHWRHGIAVCVLMGGFGPPPAAQLPPPHAPPLSRPPIPYNMPFLILQSLWKKLFKNQPC